MDVQAIQQGLADAADTITGLRCFATLPDSINPPTFATTEVEIDYDKAFGAGSLTDHLFTCGIFTSRGDSPTGRAALAGYLAPTGAGSVKAALEADRTLTGRAKTLRVERARGAYRLYTIAGIDYLGTMLDVRVWA